MASSAQRDREERDCHQDGGDLKEAGKLSHKQSPGSNARWLEL
jgi:hypothetical protein